MQTPPEDELLFLTLHHLHTYASNPAVANALHSLETAFANLQKLPTAPDYTGHNHSLTYQQCARRFPHIPPSYLREILTTHLPKSPLAPATLLATGRFASTVRKRPRAASLHASRRIFRHHASNVAVLLHQQQSLPIVHPIHRLTFPLLPKAFHRLKRLVGHHLPVFTTLFDHHSHKLISGSDDHLIKIWSTQTGYLLHTLRGHDSDITEIIKHPTRPIIVSASSDTTLRVWHIHSGAALHVLDGGSQEVNVAMFSPCPDRPYLVSGGADGSARLWNADNFQAGFIRIPIPVPRSSQAVSTDTRHANPAAANSHRPSSPLPHPHPTGIPQPPAPANSAQRSVQTGSNPPGASANATANPRHESRHAANSMVSSSPTYEVLSVSFNAGATRLAISGTDCVAHLFAIETSDSNSPFPQLRLLTSLRGHSEHIIQVLFSRSGDSIVTACRDGTARIWNRVKARLPIGRKRKQSVSGMGSWSSVVLDCRSQIQADASALSIGASGSACGSIAPRARFASYPVSVCAAMWSLNDKYVFTASSDTKIRVWHAETGKLARSLEGHEREVYVMDCHPLDSRILLTAGYDGKCFLWDVETGKRLRTFSICDDVGDSNSNPSRIEGSISDGQFSPDGLSFVVSDTSGGLTLFGAGSGESIALAPVEQFFSDDCAPFRRDAQNRAIDENTGILLHLKQKGRLCDKEFRAHPPELQPGLPARNLGKAPQNEDEILEADGNSELNYVQNQNRNALVLRAKEFRENQEKEEKRLLREAREARQRAVVDREKRALEKDLEPAYLAPRDFEVQDSECDDSDADFEGDDEVMSGASESSSSSEEDDDSLQADDSNRRDIMNRKRARSEAPEKSINLSKRSGLRRLRRKSDDSKEQVDSGNSEGIAVDDSDEYEMESQENDSDSSMSSGERRRARKKKRGFAYDLAENRTSTEGKPSETRAAASVRDINEMDSIPLTPRFSAPILNGPRLGGASFGDGQRRMRIHIPNKLSGRLSIGPHRSVSSAPGHPAEREGAECQTLPNTTAATHNLAGASSFASHEARGHPSDAAGIAGVHTPMNPSFTSERKDDTGPSNRVSKPLEDHQGDTASCIRPRLSLEDTEGVQAARTMHESNLQHVSVVDKSTGTLKAVNSLTDSRMKNDIAGPFNDVSQLNKIDSLEKSLLSDSPACLFRKKGRARTRNAAANQPAEDFITPVIDIDEIANRELEILEEQGQRKFSRKRRKKSHQDHSEDEQTSEDRDAIGSRKPETDEGGELPKRLKAQRKRSTRGNGAPLGRDRASASGGSEGMCLASSAWLRSSSNRYTYIPQLGDDVMYFPQGHVTAMEFSKSIGLDPLAGRAYNKKGGKELLDGSSFGKEAPPVRFQICDISYEFPVSLPIARPRSVTAKAKGSEVKIKKKTIVVLTLRLVSGMKRKEGQRDLFLLPYYPVDAPEYLVLTSRVESALCRSWKAGDRFRILFLNEHRAWQYYTGTIRAVRPAIRTVMWNMVEVEYDNEGEKEKGSNEFVSPWELEPFDILQGAKENLPQFTQMIRSSSVEPGLFPIIARELDNIRNLESSWRTQLSWLDTVDNLANIPGYCDKIPYPMDFNTVVVRLCTGYYRHFCSYLHDISLLKNNSDLFHTEQSEMARLASSVFTRIVETSERVRAQFVTSMMAVPQAHNHSAALSGTARSLRPRPANAEISGSIGTMVGQIGGMSNTARHFPIPMNMRQSNSGFAVPSHPQDAAGNQSFAANPQRVLASMRHTHTNGQMHVLGANPYLGVSLPPALPSPASTGITTRGSGKGRVSTRAQNVRYNTGHVQRGNTGNGGRGYLQVSGAAGSAGSLPNAAASCVSSPFLSPQVTSPLQYQHANVMMGTNSSHTLTTPQVIPSRIAPSSTRSHPRVATKLGRQIVGNVGINIASGSENAIAATSRAFTPTGVMSPRQDVAANHGAAGVSTSITQPSGYGAMSRHNNNMRAVADGGTHSWGGSMEAAGGMFPLQASSSDSHLHAPVQGRSQSPISPSVGLSGHRNTGIGQQGMSGVAGAGAAYHEHSTVSVAAAESTMSCGGADVELQAESVEVGTLRPRKTR